MRDCLGRNEAPLASHLLYTQPGVLDDDDPHERLLGMEAGLAWGRVAELTAVYVDLGISDGMRRGMERADLQGRKVVKRTLGPATMAALKEAGHLPAPASAESSPAV